MAAEQAYGKRIEELAKDFAPVVGLGALDKIERLAPRLRQAKSIGAVLSRYQPLDEQLELLETVVHQVAMDWDRWVQHQIDVARGK